MSTSPNAREPISAAISFDLRRKRRIMMEGVNVSNGKTKMDKMVGKRELPCIRRSRAKYRGRVVYDGVLNVDGKKKWGRSKEEANKRSDGKKRPFVARSAEFE
jgi:hypothetical protein